MSLAGHEVSRIVSCIVAKRADETAYVLLARQQQQQQQQQNYVD